MIKNGVSSIFLDWSVILSANLCKSRVDVYIDNPCDIWNRAHVYGNILLNIPFVKISSILLFNITNYYEFFIYLCSGKFF